MKRVLIVGSGDVARRALPWLVRRFKVFALTRSRESCAALRALGATPLTGDLDDRGTLARFAGLADIILHFAPPPSSGNTDTRTRNLLATQMLRGSLPQRLVYISTTGVYGDCGGVLVHETRPCRPRNARALRRVDAEQRLRAFGVRNGVTVSILRAPGIYASERLPVERLRRGDPVLTADDDVFTSHIHADDLAMLACRAIFRAAPGRIYNAADDTRLKMGEYFDLAADFFALTRPPRMSRTEIVAHLSPMALSFMSESRRLDNTRIGRELGYRLVYPTVCDGFVAART